MSSSSGLSVIVTGASRGFGRSVVSALCKSAGASSVPLNLVLVGRDMQRLEDSQRMAVEGGAAQVELVVGDLGDMDTLDHTVGEVVAALPKCEDAVLVNNAGSIEPMYPMVSEEMTLKELQESLNLNVTSTMWLTKRFLEATAVAPRDDAPTRVSVGNVSSLAAVTPVPSWAAYCTVKAARDMFHHVVALERRHYDPGCDVRVLNYAPGPMVTDMSAAIRAGAGGNPDLAERVMDKGRYVDVDYSATCFVNLLLGGEYENAAHVDVFDLGPPQMHRPE